MTGLLLDEEWVFAIRSKSPWVRTIGMDILARQVTGRYRPNGPSDPLVRWVAQHSNLRGQAFDPLIGFPEEQMDFSSLPGLRRYYR